MDRVINYAFLLLLIFLFVLDATPDERARIGMAVVGAVAFSYLVFIFNWITLDGAAAASVLGIIILGLGGWEITFLLLLFFTSSTLISGRSIVKIEEAAQAFAERSRRDGVQVWSNGFWIAFFVILSSVFNQHLLLMGGVGAIAVATADTWATELGSTRFTAKTYLITSFETISPQTDGGISWPGTLAAITGSLVIAFGAVLLYSIPVAAGLLSIFFAGFLGCLADSYFGATLQQDTEEIASQVSGASPFIKRDNNFVNWAATGVGSFVAVIINVILL